MAYLLDLCTISSGQAGDKLQNIDVIEKKYVKFDAIFHEIEKGSIFNRAQMVILLCFPEVQHIYCNG